jgi:outer membrane protein assembly factor BamB
MKPLPLTLLVFFIIKSTFGDDWSRFRGENGRGIFPKLNLPQSLNSDSFKWEVKLPGVGHASPVVWGNKVFTTCASTDGTKQYVLSFDSKSGKQLWVKQFETNPFSLHKFNSFASATPAVDSDYILVSWTTKKSNDLLCIDHQGEVIWRRNFGEYQTQHGNGFSPVIYGNQVFVTHDHEGDSAIYSLNRENGHTLWKVRRDGSKPSSSTPVIYKVQSGETFIVSNSKSHGCYAIDIKSGRIAWETGTDSLDKRSVSSPFFGGGFFFASCGSGGRGSRLLVIKPPAINGQNPQIKHIISRNVPYVPTSLVQDNFLFILSDSGIVSAIDLETAEVLWKERIAANFFASPISCGNIIYVPSRDGKIFSLEANRKGFKILRTSELNEVIHNTPALSKDGIFIRTFSRLIHINAKT